MAPVTTLGTPVTALPAAHTGTSVHLGHEPAVSRPSTTARAGATDRECLVCGVLFSATRPTARCCSGRCRIMLSRTRRVADLIRRLAAAEAGLAAAEHAIKNAAAAVRDLRALAEQGGPKVAP